MLRVTIACLTVLFATLTGGVSVAQESPLAYFNDQVDIVLRLREPDQTFEKLAAFVNKIQPGVGDLVRERQNEVLGQLISNPALTGVDLSRDWYLGVYTEKDEPPVVVFAIPSTNTDDLVGALGTGVVSQVQKKWVLYTEAEAIPAAGAATLVTLDEQIRKRITSGDFSVYVNSSHLTVVYADQLELLQEQVLDGLNNLRFAETDAGIDFDAVARMYGKMAESFFKLLMDAQDSTVSISLSETEIAIDKSVTFQEGSDSAKFIANQPKSRFEQLARLPGNWPIYSGLSGDVNELVSWSTSFSSEMLKLGEEQKVALDEMKAEIAKVKYGPILMAADIVDSSGGAFRGANLIEAAPMETLKSLTRKGQVKLGTLTTDAFEQTTTIQEDAETYGQYPCDLVQVKQTYTDKGDPTGVGRKTQELMFGSEGMTMRYCYLEKYCVNTFGGGKQLMKDLVTAIDSGKSNKIAKFRGTLMEEANVLVLLDLPGILGRGLKIAAKVEGSPLMVNPQAVDNLGQPVSYVGIAIGSDGKVLNSQLRVPVDQIVGLTKLGVLIAASMKTGI